MMLMNSLKKGIQNPLKEVNTNLERGTALPASITVDAALEAASTAASSSFDFLYS